MQDATEQFGEGPEGLFHIARFKARAGRTEEATTDIERALELKPEYRQYAEKDADLAPLLGVAGEP